MVSLLSVNPRILLIALLVTACAGDGTGLDENGMPLGDEPLPGHKIQGTQASVAGSGDRMPLIGGALTEPEIAVIRAWIAAGALDN